MWWPSRQKSGGSYASIASSVVPMTRNCPGRSRRLKTATTRPRPVADGALTHGLALGPFVGDHIAEAQVHRGQPFLGGEVEELDVVRLDDME